MNVENFKVALLGAGISAGAALGGAMLDGTLKHNNDTEITACYRLETTFENDNARQNCLAAVGDDELDAANGVVQATEVFGLVGMFVSAVAIGKTAVTRER
jgi:hypothetical protein